MMRAPNWQPIAQADKAGRWYARDADRMEAWTWHDGDEWWTPVEYRADA